MKSLPAWFDDLCQRMNFFHSWVESQRQPAVYWISAFSYPTAFLTAVLQKTARKEQIAVDQLSWEFDVTKSEDKHLLDIDDGIKSKEHYVKQNRCSWLHLCQPFI